MEYIVTVESTPPLILAAIRATVPQGGIATVWKPALDKVWAFLRDNPIPNAGLNVFVYHQAASGGLIDIDFGVQVLDPFDTPGEISCVKTPSGAIASTVHTGPYHRLGEAHAAVRQWCSANPRALAGTSWEIYGHWNNDPENLTTTVCYLLA